ncbi:proline--tRNA ligase [Candidatus Dojkabacteria bacterium]|nr:proline--tRNA ligase [Candidatus Dojkabacteria bacterium]
MGKQDSAKAIKKLDKLTPRSQNQSKWYQEVVLKTDLADYSPVRGCMVIKPYGYAIWELIQKELDQRIVNMGAKNAYFPIFIPYSFLEKEADHVEGFAPEVATVTHAGGKELEEKLAVRPTSETIIYSMFANWIESYRDLPYKINQWGNVVRWEKRTTPFLRTSEFLWQEGHTLHATKEEANIQVLDALKVYRKFLEDNLSLCVVAGKKTEAEKFAGAEETYTVESLMKDGKALQVGTTHLLSHSFVESFGVDFLDENGDRKTPWATSWGMSTRMIGGLIMAHGDDKGLVLPPRVAPVQIVIIPISKSGDEFKKERETLQRFIVSAVKPALAEVRYEVDWSDNSPGWKFANWEMKGVPIRLEIGAREIKSGELSFAIRFNGEKDSIKIDSLGEWVTQKLAEIGDDMLAAHKEFTAENTREVSSYAEFKEVIKRDRGYVKVMFDQKDSAPESEIKAETKATTRCMPFEEDDIDKGLERATGKCFYSGDEGGAVTLFARAY